MPIPVYSAETTAAVEEKLHACGISVRNLSVAFDAQNDILRALNLEVAPAEIIALVGASGCGKSTLLRTLAGLLPPKAGEVRFHGPATRRTGDLAYVFQDPTLLAWRTVAENVGLPFELGRAAGNRRDSISKSSAIEQVLSAVGLSHEDHCKFPRELSGGMRMRASIARALVTDPSVLLLDEPFAALDDLLRTRLNDLLLELWSARGRTIVFVTHNIAEAVYLSHRVMVMGAGIVASSHDNPLMWPRNAAQRASIEFASFYGEISRALSEANQR